MFTCEICQKQFETDNFMKKKGHSHFRSQRCVKAKVDLYEAREELYYCLKGEKHHYERYGILPDTREEQEEAFYKAGEAYDKAYKFKHDLIYKGRCEYKPRYPREKGIVY